MRDELTHGASAAIDSGEQLIKGRHVMPLINVKVIQGVFSAEQKTQIIRKLTDAMVDNEGEAMRAVTWTVIEEVSSGDWGIAGKPLTTADVKARAATRSAKVPS